MSSNYVRVSAREWRELEQYLADADAYVLAGKEEVSRIRAETEKRRKELADWNAANQKIMDRTLHTLVDGYRDLLESVNVNSAAARSGAFKSELQDLLANAETAAGRIRDTDRRVNALAQQYSSVFQAMQDKRTGKKDRAEAIQTELESLLSRIEALNPEQFLPDAYRALVFLDRAVTRNMEAGDYDAALSVSRNAVLDASGTLTRLTLLREQYCRQRNAVCSRAADLRTKVNTLDSSAGVLRAELHGRTLEYRYDIGYWSNGAFDRLKQRLTELENQLAGNLTAQALTQTGQILSRLEAELDNCDRQSRHALLGTVFAEDTAARLRGSLCERGWGMIEEGHYDGESCNPYVMQYDDGNGNTVSIVVSPGDRAEEPAYAIEVFSDDEYHAAAIKESVMETIGDQGVDLLSVEQRTDCDQNPDPETFVTNMVRETLTSRS